MLINVVGGSPGRTEQPARQTSPLPGGFTDFVPAFDQRPDDIVVTKRTGGALASTNLEGN